MLETDLPATSLSWDDMKLPGFFSFPLLLLHVCRIRGILKQPYDTICVLGLEHCVLAPDLMLWTRTGSPVPISRPKESFGFSESAGPFIWVMLDAVSTPQMLIC